MPSRRSRAGSSSGTPGDEEPLGTYRAMRDFTRTPEPAGDEPASSGAPRFVVQRHRARALHYDVRLEMDGVLVSWAVPRGPTLDPKARRLAVHVEDHPLEYAAFEGVIPSGEYGGGDVIVWDEGTWTPWSDDPRAEVAAGEVHATLHGSRLRGTFVLVRTSKPGEGGSGSGSGSGKEQWLLLHKSDEHAVPGWDAEDHPTSVVTGRTNDEVKAHPERLWRSDLPAAEASVELAPGGLPDGVTDDELAALDDLGAAGTWHVHGRALRLTNLDKELFPGRGDEPPVTKRELVRYAARIAPVVLPYLRGRALNMHRFPDGAGPDAAKGGFWHKELPTHAPAWLPRWENPEADRGETRTYLVVDEPAALVWAANFGALEWHAWTSPTAAPRRPDYALVDIDPGPSTAWEDVVLLARLHRDAFEHLGVRAQPKLTGRRGIQIWVPIASGPSFDETRAWVERLSTTVGRVVPDLVSWRWEVRERGGQARLDYTQNAINKTLVAPYSPRAAAGAPVSAPITWDELDADWLRSDAVTVRTVLDRIAQRGDPFRAVLAGDQVLPPLT